jgi:predicted nucleotidyltransferase
MHRALWASLFIKTIQRQKPPTTLQAPSLREVLINSKLNVEAIKKIDQTFTADPIIEAEMKEMFVSGISLNPIVFQQKRILKATVNSYADASIVKEDEL